MTAINVLTNMINYNNVDIESYKAQILRFEAQLETARRASMQLEEDNKQLQLAILKLEAVSE